MNNYTGPIVTLSISDYENLKSQAETVLDLLNEKFVYVDYGRNIRISKCPNDAGIEALLKLIKEKDNEITANRIAIYDLKREIEELKRNAKK